MTASHTDPREKDQLRQMLDESNTRIREIRVKEEKAISEGRFDYATQLAYLRIDEQKRFNQILGQITGAL